MSNINASELIRYNANTRGTNTSDCTARAISLAFNMDYSKARKALNDSAKANWKYHWDYNTTDNVNKVVRELGGIAYSQPEKITVGDWADAHSSGTYIIDCNKTGDKYGPGGHLVCCIDGKIYDSWDSRKYFVLGYWKIPAGTTSADITDIGSHLKEWFHSRDLKGYCEYVNSVFDNIVNKNRKLKKLASAYDCAISMTIRVDKLSLKDYTFSCFYSIFVTIPECRIDKKKFQTKLAIAFKPTLPIDKLEEYFNTTFYDKMYFFVHNIVDKIEDICEGYQLIKDSATSENLYFYDNLTRRSFNALPYWVQKLTTYFNVRNPFEGEYSDRVELSIITPKFDTKYGEYTENSGSRDERSFHAYNMGDLMRGLQYYKKTGDFDKAYLIAGDY